MKTIIPPPPQTPHERFALPDHRHLPAKEGERPSEVFSGKVPDHTQLPDKDGTFVRNTFETLENHLLTDSIRPRLRAVVPDGDFFIGEDCGIYWKLTDPLEQGCKAPDWYVVVGVPALLNGQLRRSYVLWEEIIAPLVILEYVSGDGADERDVTPNVGKFWVYEQAIRAPYYAIYDPNSEKLEFFRSDTGRLTRQEPNAHGRYPIDALGIELGIWRGPYAGYSLPWLRWWDAQGNLLLTGEERAEKLAEKLRALGVDPDRV